MHLLFIDFLFRTNVLICYREKELAAVKINAAEVDIIANELEVKTFPLLTPFSKHIVLPIHTSCCLQLDKKVAERALHEHKGDFASIRYLLH